MQQYDLSYVPGTEHYRLSYLKGGRLFSFAHQLNEVVALAPTTVLEVGAGGGLVSGALRSVGIEVTTADIQPELHPDLLAPVTSLPVSDKCFDVSICCQVLEHLPFDQFVPALAELRRVTRIALVLSLPDVTRQGFFNMKVPLLSEVRLQWSLPLAVPAPEMPRVKLEKNGHRWEIGYAGSSLNDVTKGIDAAGWAVARTWRVPELPWHRFFRCT